LDGHLFDIMMEFEILTELIQSFKRACEDLDIVPEIKESNKKMTTVQVKTTFTRLFALGMCTSLKSLS